MDNAEAWVEQLLCCRDRGEFADLIRAVCRAKGTADAAVVKHGSVRSSLGMSAEEYNAARVHLIGLIASHAADVPPPPEAP